MHTPGTWKAVGRAIFVDGEKDKMIAVCEFDSNEGGTIEPQESWANAQLIAAAPDMMQVLSDYFSGGELDIDKAWKALNKAMPSSDTL